MNPKAALLIGAATMTLAMSGAAAALADGYPARATPIVKSAPKAALKPVVKTRVKVVERPVYVEKVVKQLVYVDHPVDRVVEKRVEVPVVKVVEKVVDRPVYIDRPVDRIVEKRVEVPVDRVVEKRVEVPVEKIVRVPVYVERQEQRGDCRCEDDQRVPEDRGYRQQGRVESSVERSEETYESESSRYSEVSQGWSYQGSYMAGDGYAQSLEGTASGGYYGSSTARYGVGGGWIGGQAYGRSGYARSRSSAAASSSAQASSSASSSVSVTVSRGNRYGGGHGGGSTSGHGGCCGR